MIAAALAEPHPGLGGHGLLGAAELSHIFAVGARLKALALQQPMLPATRVQAHHWWAAGRDDERHVHEAQVGAGASHSVLKGGHYTLLRQAALLNRLEQLLAGQAERV